MTDKMITTMRTSFDKDKFNKVINELSSGQKLAKPLNEHSPMLIKNAVTDLAPLQDHIKQLAEGAMFTATLSNEEGDDTYECMFTRVDGVMDMPMIFIRMNDHLLGDVVSFAYFVLKDSRLFHVEIKQKEQRVLH